MKLWLIITDLGQLVIHNKTKPDRELIYKLLEEIDIGFVVRELKIQDIEEIQEKCLILVGFGE